MNVTNGRQLQPAPFDAWAVLDFWLRRWRWLACWTVVLALAGAGIAHVMWSRSFTSTAQLIHYEPSAIDDTFHPRALATPSLVVMLQSPGLLEEVGSHLQPPVSAKDLASHLQITLDRNNDVATVTATGASAAESIDLVKRFCDAAIAYTQTMQRQEATEAGDSVNRQLTQVETEIATARAAIPTGSVATVAALAATPDDTAPAIATDLPLRIQAARDQLDDLLVRYTDVHPLVREQRARLAALEEIQRRSAPGTTRKFSRGTAPRGAAGGLAGVLWPHHARGSRDGRALPQLGDQPRAAHRPPAGDPAVPRKPSRLLSRPPVRHGEPDARAPPSSGDRAVCLSRRIFRPFRFRRSDSARRVFGQPHQDARRCPARHRPAAPCHARRFESDGARRPGPVGVPRVDGAAEQAQHFSEPRHGLRHHVRPSRRRAFDVGQPARARRRQLRISRPHRHRAAVTRHCSGARPSRQATGGPGAHRDAVRRFRRRRADGERALHAEPDRGATHGSGFRAPRVNIPLPGWVWDLERRKRWQSALEVWRAIEHVVIFVELPPASVAETVLLAENIPNLLWLVDSNRSDAAETHSDLETLRDARCNLVGAVLNRERAAPVRGRFGRWLGSSAVLLFFGFGLALPAPKISAAELEAISPGATTAVAAPAAFSVVNSAQRASWQQRLTLGPGDVLGFHLFGSPELTREEVPIGPDGRVSYLEAENILATGLTVDELRDRLNDELGRFRRAPQAFVTPQSYHSKRYYVLGTVVQKGIFPLDRPITIIEAVARAHGFETGVSSGDVVETTDFTHSFIERGGRRLPVDFEKLFLHGDLSQNVALEPGDYLHFPALASGSIYVLGEVRTPGAVTFDSDTNVLSAIATRGGFTQRAWKKRVLVVRGSRDHPEAFKVDAFGALNGNASNLALQPGDFVYVSNRPWIRVEELLDRATSAFVESAVVSWTGVHAVIGGGGNSNPAP